MSEPKYIQPETYAEYQFNAQTNYQVTGFGLDVGMTVPCPFCAAPGFASWKIIDCQQEMIKEHICSECGRGSMTVFHEDSVSGKTFEFVQTRGSEMQAWHPWRMRRVEVPAKE